MTKPKKKRGRPSKTGVSRTPSGQISRAKNPPKDIMDTALAYRKQHYGLPDGLTTEQQKAAATVYGRLWLSGKITESMWKAAEQYRGLYEAKQRAIEAPVGLRKPGSSPTWRNELSPEDYAERAVTAIARWENTRLKGWPALQMAVIDDMEISAELIHELRHVLSVLAVNFGIEKFAAAACQD